MASLIIRRAVQYTTNQPQTVCLSTVPHAMIAAFDPGFLARSPILSTLSWLAPQLDWQDWPSQHQLDTLNSPHDGPVIPRFRYPTDNEAEATYYEWTVYQHRTVPTRRENWHDLFNALCWLTFPRIKHALNLRHIDELKQQNGLHQRTRKRDAATLLDESGILLAYTDTQLIDALNQHHWNKLFVSNRQAWGKQIQPFVIGHALLERAHQPFIGMTAKVLPVRVEADFFSLPHTIQLAQLDKIVSVAFADTAFLSTPREMPPLPLLGIPGWHPDNLNPMFYQNLDYFRPKRDQTAAEK
ncbi:DUF3025 domain-containing protein [Chitinivorax sp. B]|uniref:DUF3025 domain-containing protein n=1 Tax=Chitinivorax sp. B TaxID=2502235 RepID=UPI0010F6BB9D|nr:DUF3025 domain-containing protein [Chitinivorax sp. B]